MLNGEAIWGKETWKRFQTEVQEARDGLSLLRKFETGDANGTARNKLVDSVKELLEEVKALTGGSVEHTTPDEGVSRAGVPWEGLTFTVAAPRNKLYTFQVSWDLSFVCAGPSVGDPSEAGLKMTYCEHAAFCLKGNAGIVYALPFVRKHVIRFVQQILELMKEHYEVSEDLTPPSLGLEEGDEGDREE